MKAKDWIKKLQALPEEAEVNMWLFNTQDFMDYVPREGVKGSDYFSQDFVQKWRVPKTESVKVKEKDLFSE